MQDGKLYDAYALDLLRTFALPSPYLGRFMFGFRDEIRGCTRGCRAMVLSWYGVGASCI